MQIDLEIQRKFQVALMHVLIRYWYWIGIEFAMVNSNWIDGFEILQGNI